jgi:hypothetical protein
MRRFQLFSLCTASAVALAVALSVGGNAGGGEPGLGINPQGKPKDFKEGNVKSYAVWHSKKGWHLRTTTKMYEHNFRGRITVEGGTFVQVHSFQLEKTGKLADYWKLGPKRHNLTFDFKTDKGIDGVNFTLSSEAKRIRFDLYIDGKHEPMRVFIGQAGAHPPEIPFTLRAHPGRKK